MRAYVSGVIFLLVANIMDVIYTRDLIVNGKATEFNPMMDWVIQNYGFCGMAILKTSLVFIVSLLFILLHINGHRPTKVLDTVFGIGVGAYAILTVYHLFIQATI